jgi:tRNA 2-selenouridine synthase
MKILSIQAFLDQSRGKYILDVRSEGEFQKGRVWGASNIPLFNNLERAQVGTTYKQVGKEEAILQGLEIVGPKMADIVKTVNVSNPTKEVYIYCWRGGKRSGSVGWLLNTAGYQVFLLQGGYKAYRREVNHFLDTAPLQLRVIGGCTGSGKTEILQKLQERGEQVIDLEKLAHHKGSAFGGLGQPPPPTKEDFDNRLYAALSSMDLTKPIWVEDESKNIGQIFLPPQITQLIQTSPVYNIMVPAADRIERLVTEYSIHPVHELLACLDKIKKRLGGQVYKDAVQALDEKNFKHLVQLILFYYDRTYVKHLELKKERIVKEIEVLHQNYAGAVDALLQKT